MNVNLQAICSKLEVNPVFQMSLNSKELFHSNVLAWFCKTFPKEAQEVFGQWVPSSTSTRHQILREKNNLDLLIEIPNLAPIVIENKVFAAPDDEQLNAYSEKAVVRNLKNPCLILLSLGKPNWDDNIFVSPTGKTWKYLSYQDLSNALRDAIKSIPGFEGDLLQHYVEVVDLLQGILDNVSAIEPEEQVFLSASTRSLLEQVRMADAFGKLRARQLVVTLRQSWKSSTHANRTKFEMAFTNGEPLIEGNVMNKNGDRLGWQYQAGDWRLAVWCAKHQGDSEDLRKKRENHVAKEYADWFDFEPVSALIQPESKISKMESSGGFLKFNPEFVYRKRKLKGLTLADLEKISNHYLARAIALAR